jgi:hypothetical protein
MGGLAELIARYGGTAFGLGAAVSSLKTICSYKVQRATLRDQAEARRATLRDQAEARQATLRDQAEARRDAMSALGDEGFREVLPQLDPQVALAMLGSLACECHDGLVPQRHRTSRGRLAEPP